MKKLILSLVAVLTVAGSVKATILAQYQFNSGSLNSTDGDLTSSATGITKGAGLTTSSTVTTGANPYFKFDGHDANFSGIPAGVTANDYISFTLTAGSGHFLSFNTMTFDVLGSNSKIGAWAIRSSQDNFASDIATGSIPTGNSFTPAGSVNNLSGLNQHVSSIEFRIYAVNNQGVSDIGVDNISLDGTTPVPEPTNVALVLFGCTFAGVGAGRKFLKKKAA